MTRPANRPLVCGIPEAAHRSLLSREDANTAILEAYRHSTPHVERLSLKKGPFERPEAVGIDDVCGTLWKRCGKRLRPHIVYWFGELAGADPQELDLYAWAAEAIHTATLLHDDVIDDADRRRGGSTANALYDNTLPVLSGDYLICDVIHQLSVRGKREIFELLAETLKRLCSGEFLQYEQRYRIPEDPGVYERVAELKTTSLFLWCALVGPLLTDFPETSAVKAYIRRFGRLFQLSDDVLDAQGNDDKPRSSDLREGKLNRVTWELVRADPALRAETETCFLMRHVPSRLIGRFEEHPALPAVVGKTRERLALLADEAASALAPLPDTAIRRALQEFAGLCVDRCG